MFYEKKTAHDVAVFDLDRSMDFYTARLGMQLLRQREYPEGRFTLAFVSYGGEDKNNGH